MSKCSPVINQTFELLTQILLLSTRSQSLKGSPVIDPSQSLKGSPVINHSQRLKGSPVINHSQRLKGSPVINPSQRLKGSPVINPSQRLKGSPVTREHCNVYAPVNDVFHGNIAMSMYLPMMYFMGTLQCLCTCQ